MATKVKGFFKGGIKHVQDIFVKEEEHEMEIGLPTDVKHVAHIGIDGGSSVPKESPSWMNEFHGDNKAREHSRESPSHEKEERRARGGGGGGGGGGSRPSPSRNEGENAHAHAHSENQKGPKKKRRKHRDSSSSHSSAATKPSRKAKKVSGGGSHDQDQLGGVL